MYAAMALTLTAISARCLTARTGTTSPLRVIPIPTLDQRAIGQGTIPAAHITMAQDTQFIQAPVEASTITTIMETRCMFQSAGKGLFTIREGASLPLFLFNAIKQNKRCPILWLAIVAIIILSEILLGGNQ